MQSEDGGREGEEREGERVRDQARDRASETATAVREHTFHLMSTVLLDRSMSAGRIRGGGVNAEPSAFAKTRIGGQFVRGTQSMLWIAPSCGHAWASLGNPCTSTPGFKLRFCASAAALTRSAGIS